MRNILVQGFSSACVVCYFFSLCLISSTTAAFGQGGSKIASYTLINLEPYKIYYVLHYPVGQGLERTEGWWSLKPGEKRTGQLIFPAGVTPAVHVHAHSGDPDVVRWAFDLPEDHDGRVFYEGGPGDEVTFQSVTNEILDRRVRSGSRTRPEPNMDLVAFVRVPLSDTKHPKGLHTFTSDQFKSIFAEAGLRPGENPLPIYIDRAKVLGAALSRQAKFSRSWPNPGEDFPYYTGLELEDHNGAEFPGLLVTAVNAKTTIFGDEMPFQVGDIITSFADASVFHPAGLHTLLYDHATDREKGAHVPIDVQLIRENRIQSLQTLCFFNEGHWKRTDSELSQAHAFASGVEETVGLGKTGGAVLEGALRYAGTAAWNFLEWTAIEGDIHEDMEPKEFRNPVEQHWEIRQTHTRLQQMYPKAFEAGTWAGFVTPSAPRLLFTKTLGKNLVKRGLSRTAASVTSSVTLEMVEGVVWTIGSSSPLRTNQQVLDDIKKVMPFAAAGGLVSASPIRRTP